jgi:hypothetical protein
MRTYTNAFMQALVRASNLTRCDDAARVELFLPA